MTSQRPPESTTQVSKVSSTEKSSTEESSTEESTASTDTQAAQESQQQADAEQQAAQAAASQSQAAAEAAAAQAAQQTTPSSSVADDPNAQYGTVQSGEGPQQIAGRYGLSVDEFLRLNGMDRSNFYFDPGQQVRIK